MLKVISEHRSIRKFQTKPIAKSDLEDILTAATRASNTGNMQVYSIIVTSDEEKKKELCKFHFNQKMVEEAAVVLTFFVDINRFNKWCEARDAQPGYDNLLWFYNASIDALLAAQNACIEAESKGFGICILGTTTYNADKITDFFNCPKGVVPVTTVVIGYPNEQPPLTDRLPLDGVVHYETYQDYNKADIDRIYAEKEALESTQQLLKENQLPNLAQIFTQKRYPKADNEVFSARFFNVLRDAGFIK